MLIENQLSKPNSLMGGHLNFDSIFHTKPLCFVMVIWALKGVYVGPTGPSREGPGVGHKIVSDTKQMTKERKKRKK